MKYIPTSIVISGYSIIQRQPHSSCQSIDNGALLHPVKVSTGNDLLWPPARLKSSHTVHVQARIQGVGAGAGAHPWGGVPPFKMHYSIVFKHQFIIGRPPLGEILYPPLLML